MPFPFGYRAWIEAKTPDETDVAGVNRYLAAQLRFTTSCAFSPNSMRSHPHECARLRPASSCSISAPESMDGGNRFRDRRNICAAVRMRLATVVILRRILPAQPCFLPIFIAWRIHGAALHAAITVSSGDDKASEVGALGKTFAPLIDNHIPRRSPQPLQILFRRCIDNQRQVVGCATCTKSSMLNACLSVRNGVISHTVARRSFVNGAFQLPAGRQTPLPLCAHRQDEWRW